MKIDDKVLKLAEKIADKANRCCYRSDGYEEDLIEFTSNAITAYLKETQPTAEVEPSCDVVKVAGIIKAELAAQCIYTTAPIVLSEKIVAALQQKPKAEVNELVAEIEEFIKCDRVDYSEDAWGNVKSCITLKEAKELLTKCKNFIEGNYTIKSNSSNGEDLLDVLKANKMSATMYFNLKPTIEGK